MPNASNKHPQTTWHIEQPIKDKLKVIGKFRGINSLSGIARQILVEAINAYEAEHGKIDLD